MELIVEAYETHINDLLEMRLDLWPDEDYEGLKDYIFKSASI